MATGTAPHNRGSIGSANHVYYELGGSKKVAIGVWEAHNLPLVHIRKFSGRYPTKDGIALTVEQFKVLVAQINAVNDSVDLLVASQRSTASASQHTAEVEQGTDNSAGIVLA